MPSSRGRRRRRSNGRRSDRPALFVVPDTCSCPVCSGTEPDLTTLLDELTAGAAELLETGDPLDLEVLAAMVLAGGGRDDVDEALIDGLLPALEARASVEALALLLAIAALTGGRSRLEALAAVDRMAAAGVPRPAWADELAEPTTTGECWHVGDPLGVASILAGTLLRAGRTHGLVVTVDHLGGSGAREIGFVAAEELPNVLNQLCSSSDGVALARKSLDAAEFRSRLEQALDLRDAYDAGGSEHMPDLESLGIPFGEESDGPPYIGLATLLRSRLQSLPEPPRPPEIPISPLAALAKLAHANNADDSADPAEDSDDPANNAYGPELVVVDPPGFDEEEAEPKPALALPAKPNRGNAPAPIYQIKVSLRGAKPPIWRRLEVPANIGLARLHRVLQTAFGWDDSHMHVFETPYGDFGLAAPEIGHRSENPVSLEQVAPEEQSKIRYLYDFGDNWEHEIVVERLVDRQPKMRYPRCTGGRRAAPPDDCGGVYGYANLVAALADPDHPDHEDLLGWLGLEAPDEFDPAAFDLENLNRALSGPH